MGKRKAPKGECTIPPALDLSALPDLVFGAYPHEERRVREYMEWQCGDETVIHLEKVGGEALMGRKMGFWDVTTDKDKWWVITNPTSLYSQKLFPSLDYTVSFHVGVTTRMMGRGGDSEANARVRRIMPVLRKLEAGGHALDQADEAEDFQAVGMKLRECLLALAKAISRPEYGGDAEPPKLADFKGWMDLVANAVAKGESAKRVRSYLKDSATNTWELVGWLTHAANATRQDARLVHSAVGNVVDAFLAAVEKHESRAPDRCPECGSYKVTEDYRPDLGIDPPYIVLCERCEWITPQQVSPERAKAANEAAELRQKARERAAPAPRKKAAKKRGRPNVKA
jgi:hypothetical protein